MTDGSSGGALRFGLLGPVRAFRGADALDLGPVRQQAVLAVLLLNAGKPVPMQQIVAALWNGDPPENGVDVVQRCIGGLRRALDPSLLAYTEGGYVLRVDQNSVDTGMFRAALAQAQSEYQTGNIHTATIGVRGALDMWEDEPLAGLTGAFFQEARERLNSERTNASSLLAVPDPARPVPRTVEAAAPPPTPAPPPTRSAPPPTPPAPQPSADRPISPAPAHRAPQAPADRPISPAPPRAYPAPQPPGHRPTPPPSQPAATPSAGRSAPHSSGGLFSQDPSANRPAPSPSAGRSTPPAENIRRLPGAGNNRPPVLDPTRIDTGTDEPGYPEPVDPWGDHALFPPDPTAMS
ncbi:transcriptional activator [Actinoplanes italicus]|uniref:Transcriptional activator n=2 Tax=Actinoplanes italicus TaxID=113567 RepID=A0A2T0K8V3_9ACTN|nr:transcriptional activator [Actinoplanes italicus]